MAILVVAAFLIAGCSSAKLNVQRMTLHLEDVQKEGAFIGFYSFAAGKLPIPPDPNQVEILYYFDPDDCSQGALIGRDDRPGYLFPIGKKSWRELEKIKPPSEDKESVVGIRPLTKDKEGLVFWVKTRSGDFVLARIASLQPTSYSDLVRGGSAGLTLEWRRPEVRQ
jgi:hypothetical protein